jgi:pyridoxal phosphate enzyme (YggS family)
VTDARGDLVARAMRSLEAVRTRIAETGRDPGTVAIVAVTKGFGPIAAAAAADAGLRDVGENYAAELVASHDALGDLPLTWHYLGALQRNKLARLATRVDCYQSVSSRSDAASIAARAPGARCYVQVDVTGEPGRAGCPPAETPDVVAVARDAGLVVEGLMCVASTDPRAAPAQFAGLRRAADTLGLEGCSMGMSGDYEAACACGTTMLRLGTALFGPRPSRGSSTVA